MIRPFRGLAAADMVTLCVSCVLLVSLLLADMHGGAYGLHYFALGGILAVGLLVSVVIGAGGLPRRPGRMEVVAVGSLAGLTALSFASILWAEQRADALEGSARMLLYLALFAIAIALPWRRQTALFLVCGYVAVIVLIGGLALREAHGGDPSAYLGGRLSYPLGYQNANAAVFLTAYWVALVLATRLAVPAALRIGLFGVAGMLAPMSLLSQSRGAVIAFALTCIVVVAALPGRFRNALGIGVTLLPAALGWGRLIAVRDVADAGGAVAAHAADRAIVVIVVSGLLATACGAIWVAVDRFVPPSQRVVRIANATALVVLGLVIALGIAAGSRAHPRERVSSGWHDFSSVSYVGGFGSGLGSNRYDFWRVALDRAQKSPVAGIGSDNFLVAYMKDRRSDESPRFPHSFEVQLVSQLGVIGGLLGLAFFGASLVGAFPRRSDDAGASAVAVAVTAGAAYWLIHASVDWFWEIPGTLAPVVVLLGCAAAVRRGEPSVVRLDRFWVLVFSAVGVLAAAVLFVPWLADSLARNAAARWPSDPDGALARLDEAARLNPLSGDAAALSAQILVQRGDLQRAYDEYGRAIKRNPEYWYWHFERAAVASALGRNAAALQEIRRARGQNPLSQTLLEVERRLVAGERVGVKLADSIFAESSS